MSIDLLESFPSSSQFCLADRENIILRWLAVTFLEDVAEESFGRAL